MRRPRGRARRQNEKLGDDGAGNDEAPILELIELRFSPPTELALKQFKVE